MRLSTVGSSAKTGGFTLDGPDLLGALADHHRLFDQTAAPDASWARAARRAAGIRASRRTAAASCRSVDDEAERDRREDCRERRAGVHHPRRRPENFPAMSIGIDHIGPIELGEEERAPSAAMIATRSCVMNTGSRHTNERESDHHDVAARLQQIAGAMQHAVADDAAR